MQIFTYHVNAFTQELFHGNPAIVCILQTWLDDLILNNIAKENNVPATVFLVENENGYDIRWITPEYELTLCGHGTLAAGFIIFNFLQKDLTRIELKSRKEKLFVEKSKHHIVLDFPSKIPNKVTIPSIIQKSLSHSPVEFYEYELERCLAVFSSRRDIESLLPNIEMLKGMPYVGLTVTAPDNEYDFVSRTFYPHKTIYEDPATGASHCLLAPYWETRLKKNSFHAKQLSQRGGEMFCEILNDRVLIKGNAILFKFGTIILNHHK